MSNMDNRRSSTEEIKNIMADGYRNILKREPDPGGFEHYVHYISSGGITKERFLEILRNSKEYGDIIANIVISEKNICRTKPHILFVTEKWCDYSPLGGPTNSEHNLFGSLE